MLKHPSLGRSLLIISIHVLLIVVNALGTGNQVINDKFLWFKGVVWVNLLFRNLLIVFW